MKEKMNHELTIENDLMQAELELEDQHTLHKIYQYISSCDMTQEEAEGIRRDLIGMAKEARVRKESLKTAIGSDQKSFCSDLVQAAVGKAIPKGRLLLKTGGRAWQVWGVASGLMSIWFIFVILYYGYTTPGKIAELTGMLQVSQLAMWFMLTVGLVESLLVFWAGRYGCRYCASRTKAKNCAVLGVLLLAYTVYSLCVGSAEFSGVLLAVLMLAFSGCYLLGAYKNSKA